MKMNKMLVPLVLVGMMVSTASYAMSEATMMFVPKSAASSAFEIESSRLALHRTHNPQIRDFAQQMIVDHSKASAKMKAILIADRMPPAPKGFEDKQIRMLNKLHSLHGRAFDAAYVRDQQKAHMEAISLFSTYADDGDNRDLKNFAATTLPVLEHHKHMIDEISANW